MSEITSIAFLPRHIGGTVFDATFEESHTSELEITDSPVETGSSTTDHSYLKPYKLRIVVGTTNTPLRDNFDEFGQGNNRIRAAYEWLLGLQASREPFDVNTGLKFYTNMLIGSITVPQDKSSANAVEFTLELREIDITFTQTVTYPARKAGKTTNQASKKKEKGEQQAKDTPAAAPPGKSALKRLAAARGS